MFSKQSRKYVRHVLNLFKTRLAFELIIFYLYSSLITTDREVSQFLCNKSLSLFFYELSLNASYFAYSILFQMLKLYRKLISHSLLSIFQQFFSLDLNTFKFIYIFSFLYFSLQEQYQFCYKMIQKYIDSFSTYSNFTD